MGATETPTSIDYRHGATNGGFMNHNGFGHQQDGKQRNGFYAQNGYHPHHQNGYPNPVADDQHHQYPPAYQTQDSSAANPRSQRHNRKRHRSNEHHHHRLLAVVTSRRRRYIPWASLVALLVTWIGLFLFSTKLYEGMLDFEEQSRGIFAFLIPYLHKVRQAVVILAVCMAAITLMMAVVGFFATLHCDHCYRGRMASCTCSRLGGRVVCALFWILSYLLNLCWMGILSCMVVMTSAYFAFLPVCLPQSGTLDTYCLNFTVLSNLMGGDANAVNLLLCGGVIDKLCKLTKAILPWYWGAYLGCVAVLLGLSHFNGTLAANFAHGKHAIRYVKIRDRTSSTIRWTKDWRVKSLQYFDLNSDSTVSLRKRRIRPSENEYAPPPLAQSIDLEQAERTSKKSHSSSPRKSEPSRSKRRDSISSCSDETESETEFEHSPSTDLKSGSTGSIVLSLQQSRSEPRRALALPASPPPKSMPPVPPYKPRPSSTTLSNGHHTTPIDYRPPVPLKPMSRPTSLLTPPQSNSSSSLSESNHRKEVQV